MTFRCGLVVNPVAGLGGAAGLKGSDGADIQAEAISRGAMPWAHERAVRALRGLPASGVSVVIVTGAGDLGEFSSLAAGHTPELVYRQAGDVTSSVDTEVLTRRLVAAGVDIIVFVGGDGTARDVCSVVGDEHLVLGVPAGVKMHSGVFAVTPESAGRVLREVMGGRVSGIGAEVVDIDEQSRREGLLRVRLYGVMKVPQLPRGIQRGKRSSQPGEAAVVAGMAAEIGERMHSPEIFLFGPGATIQGVGRMLGLEFSLLGVDAVEEGVVVGPDLHAEALNRLIGERRFAAVISPIGGQGVIIGRGNQQIDARLWTRLDPGDLHVVCSPEKLGGLGGGPLYLDMPTESLNRKFAGPRRVVTGYRQEAVVRMI